MLVDVGLFADTIRSQLGDKYSGDGGSCQASHASFHDDMAGGRHYDDFMAVMNQQGDDGYCLGDNIEWEQRTRNEVFCA